jgi:hypothetical protein
MTRQTVKVIIVPKKEERWEGKMNHTAFLANTRKTLSIIDEKINGVGFEPTIKNKLSAPLFDIAHDHAKAIVILLEAPIYASAYALVRPLIESFVRAAWIQHCASDDDIKDIVKKDDFPLSFGKMLNAVEEKRGWEKTLTQLKKSAWKSMHSYTHGGMQLISRRFKDANVEHNIDKEEIIGILQLVNLIAFLSLNEMIGMSIGYEKEQNILNDLFEDLCRWCFTDQIK